MNSKKQMNINKFIESLGWLEDYYPKDFLSQMKGSQEIEEPIYSIGVDQYDKNVNVYCLIKKFNGETEIIIQKTIRDEDEFKQEVDNLAKYFNAKIL